MSYTFSEELYSDLHKDALGFRPKAAEWLSWKSMSDDEKQAHWDVLIRTMEEDEKQREIDEANMLATVETRIAREIAAGATRREAIDRLMTEQDALGDPDFLCFKLGIPYGTFRQDFPPLPVTA